MKQTPTKYITIDREKLAAALEKTFKDGFQSALSATRQSLVIAERNTAEMTMAAKLLELTPEKFDEFVFNLAKGEEKQEPSKIIKPNIFPGGNSLS